MIDFFPAPTSVEEVIYFEDDYIFKAKRPNLCC